MFTETKKVFVYWNLHKKCWSVKALDGPLKGKVVGHRNFFLMKEVTPKVSEAGRLRVIRERKKNVHAGLIGEPAELMFGGARDIKNILEDYVTLRYNPYRYKSFVYSELDIEFIKSEGAMFMPTGEVIGWGIE